MGAKGPNTFDCSGFVYWALNKAGVSQGYMTSSGWGSCTKYEREYDFNSLKRGDVVVFSGHVGIYLGGGSMIDASSAFFMSLFQKETACLNLYGISDNIK